MYIYIYILKIRNRYVSDSDFLSHEFLKHEMECIYIYIYIFKIRNRYVSDSDFLSHEFLKHEMGCIYIYIYIYGGFYFVSLHQKQLDNHRTNFGFWCILIFLMIFFVCGQKCFNFLPLWATQD